MNKNNLILWVLIVVGVVIAAYVLVSAFRLGQHDGGNKAAVSTSG